MMKLLLGGSPCTHWSIAQSRHREVKPEGLGWELFRNYLIAKERYCPDYFLYENNKSMAPAIREQITAELGVEPILINSALVSAQNRQRLYWTNIPGVEQPMDRGLVLRDILESGLPLREKGYTLKANYANANAVNAPDSGHFPATMAAEPVNITADGKAHCLRSSYYKDGIRNLVGNACDRKTCAAQSVGINRLGGLYGQDSRWGIYDAEGKCPCLTASAGMGGGHVPMYPVPVCVNSKSGRGEIAGVQPSLADRVYSIDVKGTAVTTAFHPHIAVPASTIRIGTIESSTGSEGQGHRVYSADGKSKTLCGNGGGAGAKTGLYTVPCAGRMVGRRINEQGHRDDYNEEIERFQRFEVNEEPQKTNCLSTVHKDNLIIQTWDGKTFPVYEVLNGLITIKGREYPIRLKDGFYIIRKLTVLECMRLQTVPEDYIFPVSNSQAYKMLGNGWTVDVIAHILSYCPGILSEPLEVLSMYDGMSCGHLALDKLGAQIIRYYATEIDKYAIKTTMTNYPDTIQLGDAFGVRGDGWRSFFHPKGADNNAGL